MVNCSSGQVLLNVLLTQFRRRDMLGDCHPRFVHGSQFSVCQSAIQVLTEAGFDGLASALELLLNEVMVIERSQFLGAAPYERTKERRGHANGFKDKTLHTRVGDLQLKVPQARDSEFYPQVLERGMRSERALTAALAEMYVCGVSTRKISKIVEELCGQQGNRPA
jgi:transposase-like protein